METVEIENCIKKAQSGEAESFGMLYDEFSQRLFRFIRLKVQNRQQAEDLLQETFVKAWRGLPKYQIGRGNFSAWLYRIAGNVVTDHYRKGQRELATVELFEEVDVGIPDDAPAMLDKSFSKEYVSGLLRQLPTNYREVLELRFVSDMTIQETAEALGKNNLTVRVLQHRALKKLEKLIIDKKPIQ